MQMHNSSLHGAYHCPATAAGLTKGIIIIGAKKDSHAPALKVIFRALWFQF